MVSYEGTGNIIYVAGNIVWQLVHRSRTCRICIQEHRGSNDSNNGTTTNNQTLEIKTEDGSEVPIDTPFIPGRFPYPNEGECFSFPQTQLENMRFMFKSDYPNGMHHPHSGRL